MTLAKLTAGLTDFAEMGSACAMKEQIWVIGRVQPATNVKQIISDLTAKQNVLLLCNATATEHAKPTEHASVLPTQGGRGQIAILAGRIGIQNLELAMFCALLAQQNQFAESTLIIASRTDLAAVKIIIPEAIAKFLLLINAKMQIAESMERAIQTQGSVIAMWDMFCPIATKYLPATAPTELA